MIRLATTDFGAPVRLYTAVAGEVIALDGHRVEYRDAPTLIEAHAAQALQCMLYGRWITARRFEREARDLNAAYMEARTWRSVSMPTRKDAP